MSDYKYFLKTITKANNEVVILQLADIDGKPIFNYQPGQYVMISYLNKAGVLQKRHAFSIASSPTQTSYLTLGIKLDGEFTNGLLDLKVGDSIIVAGPYGNFVFKPNEHKDLVMLAGGIGITPFLSTMAYATELGLANQLTLLYSARTLESMIFLNDIKQLANNNSKLKVLLAITQEKLANLNPGMINERINSKIIKDFIGDIKGKTFFLCGPEEFIATSQNNLLSLGVNKSQIVTEAFSMFDDKSLWSKLKNLVYATSLAVILAAVILYSFTFDFASLFSATQLINLPWYITRASALTAFALMFAVVVLGTGMETSCVYNLLSPVKVWATHKYLSLSLSLMIFLHIGSLLFDKLLKFSLIDILVPFVSNHEPLFLSLGIFAFYILLTIIITSIFFRLRAPRFWRATHYFTYPLFALALIHGLFIGTDSSTLTMTLVYWLTGIVFVGLLIYRFVFYSFRAKLKLVNQSKSIINQD